MRLCDENCNECPLLFENPSTRQLTLILNELNDRFGTAFYRIVEDSCPNLTVCVECRVDDFVHVEGCSIVEILDSQSSAPTVNVHGLGEGAAHDPEKSGEATPQAHQKVVK